MTPAQETIKPCPFCGSSEVESINIYSMYHTFVRCKHCEGEGPARKTEDEAIKAWNTRHPEPAPEPSSTLPTEPGLYWWRNTGGINWICVKVGFNLHAKELLFKIIEPDFRFRWLTGADWSIENGIGQWLPCLPPESEVKS